MFFTAEGLYYSSWGLGIQTTLLSIIYELYIHNLEAALSCLASGMAGVSAGWEMKPQMFPVFWVSQSSVGFRSCRACRSPMCAKLLLGSVLSEEHCSWSVNVPVGFPSLFTGVTPQRFCLPESASFFLSSLFLSVTPLSSFHTYK